MEHSLYEELKQQSVEVAKLFENQSFIDYKFYFQFCANYFWEKSESITQVLLQYYIDLMGRDFQLMIDHLADIEEDLMLKISQSVSFCNGLIASKRLCNCNFLLG